MSTDLGEWHWLVLTSDVRTLGEHRGLLAAICDDHPLVPGQNLTGYAPRLHLGYWATEVDPTSDLFSSTHRLTVARSARWPRVGRLTKGTAATDRRIGGADDAWLAQQLQRADVILTLDQGAEDELTRELQDATGPAAVSRRAVTVSHRQLSAFGSGWEELESVLRGDAPARVPGVLLPGRAFPTERVLARLRAAREHSGRVAGAELAYRLRSVVPDDARDLGESGLAAELAAGALMCASSDAQAPDEQSLAAVARSALHGADSAWAQGRGHESVHRFTAACEVLFHRERHAEALTTPLVTATAEHLSALTGSVMYQALIAGADNGNGTGNNNDELDQGTPGRASPAPRASPRVLVLPGSYGGNFTAPVVAALATEAEVTELDLGSQYRPLAGKMVNVDAVRAIAATCPQHPEDLRLSDIERAAGRTLDQALQGADVVFADWVDRASVWASRRARPDQPVVVRVHSLDAFDLWIHLMDWRRVAAVVAVSPPLATLVQRFLDARGARTPVHVIPNLIPRAELDLPKTPEARTTLGMVGWGRRVKDALWTLDLLRRDPSRRLVLIGRPPVRGLTGRSQRYSEELRTALRDPQFAGRIEMVGQTDDVAGELRKVGIVVSSSRRESWHMGLVEGALSGAVPVVRDWPMLAPLGGPRTIFPEDWVVDDLHAADRRITSVSADPDSWEDARRRAQRQAERLFDPDGVAQRYRELILGACEGPGV